MCTHVRLLPSPPLMPFYHLPPLSERFSSFLFFFFFFQLKDNCFSLETAVILISTLGFFFNFKINIGEEVSQHNNWYNCELIKVYIIIYHPFFMQRNMCGQSKQLIRTYAHPLWIMTNFLEIQKLIKKLIPTALNAKMMK